MIHALLHASRHSKSETSSQLFCHWCWGWHLRPLAPSASARSQTALQPDASSQQVFSTHLLHPHFHSLSSDSVCYSKCIFPSFELILSSAWRTYTFHMVTTWCYQMFLSNLTFPPLTVTPTISILSLVTCGFSFFSDFACTGLPFKFFTQNQISLSLTPGLSARSYMCCSLGHRLSPLVPSAVSPAPIIIQSLHSLVSFSVDELTSHLSSKIEAMQGDKCIES